MFHFENSKLISKLLIDYKKYSLFEAIDYNLIKFLYNILSKFVDVINILESNKIPTIQKIIPSYYIIKNFITNFQFKIEFLNDLKLILIDYLSHLSYR